MVTVKELDTDTGPTVIPLMLLPVLEKVMFSAITSSFVRMMESVPRLGPPPVTAPQLGEEPPNKA